MLTQKEETTTADTATLTFDTSTRFGPPLENSLTSVRRLLTRFVVAGIVSLIVVSAVTAFASSRVGDRRAVAEAENITRIVSRGVVQPNADDAILSATKDSEEYRAALDQLNTIVTKTVLRGALVRIKLWARDGTVVYSDESKLIGKKFDLGDDELAIFVGAKGVAGISDLSEPENEFETENKLLQVYELTSTKIGRAHV